MFIERPWTQDDFRKEFRAIRRWELFLALTSVPTAILAIFTLIPGTNWQAVLPWFATETSQKSAELVLTLWGMALLITFFRRIGWQALGARF